MHKYIYNISTQIFKTNKFDDGYNYFSTIRIIILPLYFL